jgi:glycosyltransferase involved in cell wall biosynthesis
MKKIKWADICLVEFPWQFEFVLNHSDTDTPVVYSSHNFEPDYHEAEISESAISDRVMNKIWELEKKAALNADLIITCTNKDASRYQEEFHSDTQVVTIPNAAMAPSESELFDAKKRESPIDKNVDMATVFIGSNTIHNRSAVDNILTIAAQDSIRELDIHFYIGGSVCKHFCQEANRKNVDLLGYVDDLSSLYTDVDLGLNPVTSGGGSNIKIPDYLAHGLPVLTTPFGSRGTQLTDGSEGWIVDLANFEDKLIELSSYPKSVFSYKSKKARKLALNRLSWSVNSKDLIDRLKKLY